MARCNLAIIVPALNEEKTIENVITRIKEKGTVIVINDGSSDRTSEIAENSGAIVINHSFNKGYDEALNTGFKYAYESGFEYVITFDADEQHLGGNSGEKLSPGAN